MLIDPNTSAVLRIIPLQYNSDTLTRSFQIKGVSGEGGDRSEVLRLKGPPVEKIKLNAEIDATDQLERADPTATQLGMDLDETRQGFSITKESRPRRRISGVTAFSLIHACAIL